MPFTKNKTKHTHHTYVGDRAEMDDGLVRPDPKVCLLLRLLQSGRSKQVKECVSLPFFWLYPQKTHDNESFISFTLSWVAGRVGTFRLDKFLGANYMTHTVKTDRKTKRTDWEEEEEKQLKLGNGLFVLKVLIAVHSLVAIKGHPLMLCQEKDREQRNRYNYSFTVSLLAAAAAVAAQCVCECECNVSSESISYSLLLLDWGRRRRWEEEGGWWWKWKPNIRRRQCDVRLVQAAAAREEE